MNARLFAFATPLVAHLACSAETAVPQGGPSAAAPSADVSALLLGVPDRGDDPAVVAVDVGGVALCSAALVAPDVALTARHCVVVVDPDVAQCPSGAAPQVLGERPPSSIRILVGDDLATAQERARGSAVTEASGDVLCEADVALISLDTPIDDIHPLSVRASGAAKGDRLRTVSYGRAGGLAGLQKLVRDHLLVVDADATELAIGEPCPETWGGPAIDESTGEIVGIASRGGGPACDGLAGIDVYERADVFMPLVVDAIAASSAPAGALAGQQKTKKGAIDLGANCAVGDDCAAGICVTDALHEYCSRACGPADACPARFRCKMDIQGSWLCSL